MTNLRRLSLLILVAAVCAPATASGATLARTAGAGEANEEFLAYNAGKGERNRLTITNTKKRGVVLTDPGAKIRAKKGRGGGCKFSRNRHRATCKLDYLIPFEIKLGDRNDTIRFKGANATKLGPRARSEVTDAARLADDYRDNEGAQLQHALILGGPGNDTLKGTDGVDTIDGGPGRDKVDAGEFRDRLIDRPDGSPDTLLGGRGIDTFDAITPAQVTIDLTQNTLTSGGETDTLGSVERARGGSGDDTLVGTEGADGLFGDLGSDKVDARGGPDYLGSDLVAADTSEDGTPGVDVLTGGAGDDVLDGRDDPEVMTPTDELVCGDGNDRIVALQDDLADPSCESSVFGTLNGFVEDQTVNFSALSVVTPVARGGMRNPTYAITCAGVMGTDAPCIGKVRLETPPGPDRSATNDPTLGEGSFNIPAGTQQNVTVKLNDAGVTSLARAGERASVLVVAGSEAGGPEAEGQSARFGWQQVLGP